MDAAAALGHFYGGLVAAEGCFSRTVAGQRRDGSDRGRYVFSLEMAVADAALVRGLAAVLGVGSVREINRRRPHWQPSVCLTLNSRRAHRSRTIPFMSAFLPLGAKRRQFERWCATLDAEEQTHPNRWGQGPSTCAVDGCMGDVRGRGLCRRHYYRATGH